MSTGRGKAEEENGMKQQQEKKEMKRDRDQRQDYESVIFRDNGHVKVFINNIPDHFPSHWHIPLEVLMPLENGYTVECEGIRKELREGDVALIAPGAVHSLEAPEEGKRMFLQADLTCFPQIRELDILFSVLPALTVIDRGSAPAIREMAEETMRQIRRDYSSGYAFSGMAVYAGLFRLLALAGELFASSLEVESGEGENSRYKYTERFTAVCEYIREHCTEQITLEGTAKVAGFSKYHFAHLFREFTGVTFYKYLNQQRIMQAQRMLADPECTVAETAMQCGYASLSSFNRMFKQMKGCTPSQFRKIYDASFDREE